MNVLVIGGGGREHAIIWKLSQSKRELKLFCAPGNAGISQLAECVPIKATEIEKIVEYSVQNSMDFVMVAPDDPLALGLVDALRAVNIPAFGPTKAAAQIEASKVFSKNLMQKYNIPTAKWQSFDEYNAAVEYIKTQTAPIVIKADGLALGKGVIIAQTIDEAVCAVDEMMRGGKFSEAGKKIVVEEFMTGPEVTVLAFCDGNTIKTMPSSQDHKRVGDGDTGLNTGGMGAITPVSCYTEEMASHCMTTIFHPTIEALKLEGCTFEGVIYFGLMLTPDGAKVIEYNARFGDPECQILLMQLKTDLMDIFEAVYNKKLDKLDIEWDNGSACIIMLASQGYPDKAIVGKKIIFENDIKSLVFHSGTAYNSKELVTSGGRVLGVATKAEKLSDALSAAYRDVSQITFDGIHFRKDIGKKEITI